MTHDEHACARIDALFSEIESIRDEYGVFGKNHHAYESLALLTDPGQIPDLTEVLHIAQTVLKQRVAHAIRYAPIPVPAAVGKERK